MFCGLYILCVSDKIIKISCIQMMKSIFQVNVLCLAQKQDRTANYFSYFDNIYSYSLLQSVATWLIFFYKEKLLDYERCYVLHEFYPPIYIGVIIFNTSYVCWMHTLTPQLKHNSISFCRVQNFISTFIDFSISSMLH